VLVDPLVNHVAPRRARYRGIMRQQLLDRIDQLGGQDAYPVVPLDLFFAGNDDEGSFAPNLTPHPGIDTFYSVLRQVRDRAEVLDVVVQIDEVDTGDPGWPYASSVYVITTASADEVHAWAAALAPDESSAQSGEDYGWLGYGGRDSSTPPPGAPDVPPGFRPVVLFWD
jgi:hypothetical protein